jgi:hypothetical protein
VFDKIIIFVIVLYALTIGFYVASHEILIDHLVKENQFILKELGSKE